MKYIIKRLENGPPQIMRLFLNLFQVCYIKRTTYKNLHLLFIQYRKPFANRLENTLSGANPYWMMEWRTPCIIDYFNDRFWSNALNLYNKSQETLEWMSR